MYLRTRSAVRGEPPSAERGLERRKGLWAEGGRPLESQKGLAGLEELLLQGALACNSLAERVR